MVGCPVLQRCACCRVLRVGQRVCTAAPSIHHSALRPFLDRLPRAQAERQQLSSSLSALQEEHATAMQAAAELQQLRQQHEQLSTSHTALKAQVSSMLSWPLCRRLQATCLHACCTKGCALLPQLTAPAPSHIPVPRRPRPRAGRGLAGDDPGSRCLGGSAEGVAGGHAC